MTVFFEWPEWRGTVYQVPDRAISESMLVSLPDKTSIVLSGGGDKWVSAREVSTVNRAAIEIFSAKKVFNTGTEEASLVFNGDWIDPLWKINAAAAVNTLFSVELSQEEYERLMANNEAKFEKMKAILSPRASSLLHLEDHGGLYNDGYCLFLYRTGSCP